MNRRRGFTLVELLVALVLLTIVLGAIYRLLNNTQRISRAQAEHVDMQSNMRAGTLIVPAELRAIGFDSVPGTAPNAPVVPDLQVILPNSVQFRAYRSFGVICEVGASQLKVGTATNYAELRSPVLSPHDSLMIFIEDNPATVGDDRWVSRAITGVATGTCPDGSAARVYQTVFNGLNDALAQSQITAGSPIRTFEGMEYSLYQDGTAYYLGARSANDPGATRQPVLGPLSSNNGFHLEYYDSAGTQINGTALADRRNVRAIQVTLVGVSTQNVTSNGYGTQRQAVDSVVTLVQLRNAVHR